MPIVDGRITYNERTDTSVAVVEARELIAGDRFMSDRTSEGEVRVAYAYGQAPSDHRPDSVGVYPYPMRYGSNGWFIAIVPTDEVFLTYAAERS